MPAHNEERSIGVCLQALADDPASRALQVVVVANGCTDDTVRVARAFRGLADLHVLNIPDASKTAALNAGDAACAFYPRIYLDADIRLGDRALTALVRALGRPGALMASPRGTIDTSQSSWGVQAFYDVFARLPYANDTTSAGVYGFSEEGRARFRGFPDVVADDLFVQRLFTSSERTVVDAQNIVRAPKDLRNLVRIRARTARGNRQLAHQASRLGSFVPQTFEASTSSTVRSLMALTLADPRRWPGVVVYVGVTVCARVLSVRKGRRWERDSSTR